MVCRVLGGTGPRVSTHCLGTMMFGPRGNPDVEVGAGRSAAVR
jgi:aryl-alcohol dehydrogenase-like predicted oxidoreductase